MKAGAPDPQQLAGSFLQQAIDALSGGEVELAWGWLHKSLSLARAAENQRVIAAAGRRLAELRLEQGATEEALALAREALAAAEIIWDRHEIARCNHVSGQLLCARGEPAVGLRRLHKAVDMYGELGEIDGQLAVWRLIGEAQRLRGEAVEAIDAWERCRAVYQQRGDLAGEAAMHALIAAILAGAGDREEAVTHALAALGRHRHLADPAVEDDLRLLSRLRSEMGEMDFGEAVRVLLDEDTARRVREMILEFDRQLAAPPAPEGAPAPEAPPPAAPAPAPEPDPPAPAWEDTFLERAVAPPADDPAPAARRTSRLLAALVVLAVAAIMASMAVSLARFILG